MMIFIEERKVPFSAVGCVLARTLPLAALEPGQNARVFWPRQKRSFLAD